MSVKAVPLTCTGHSRPVTDLAFSSNDISSPYLISACKDGNPMLRDGVTGDWIGTFLGHKGAIWCSKLSEDGAFALTASADFSVILWDTSDGSQLASLPHKHIARTCDFALGATRASYNDSPEFLVITAGHEPVIRIWNTKTAQVVTQWEVDSAPIRSVLWIARSLVITVSHSGQFQWWDISDTPKLINTVDIGVGVGQVEYTNDWLVTAGGSTVYVIHSVTGQIIKQIELDYPVSAVTLSNDQTHFMTGSSSDPWIRLHSFERDGELLETSKGHHGPVHAIKYSPDGCLVASGSEDGTVRLWKTTIGPYGLWSN
ncbi:eukaryotic translation initiation factor 3 subunit I [Trichomonascus vanleenenianus]|uniref:WD40 repeat domain-containing protein n=1 Tax=Trichomonascus vanleenenianus TaxID=2268995 RepID=UPI003ECA6C03